MDLAKTLVEALMWNDLRRGFRRVEWVGDWPPAVPEGPVIGYSNHHHFYDGHLAWLLLTKRLHRPSSVWMAEYDRFPFFAAVGAQPFPPDDPARRAATLRRTARRFRDAPGTVLVYFPEGDLGPPDGGIQPFDADAVQRLGRLYPEATWWPLGLHVTWNGGAHPVARLAGGDAHETPDGRERARLQEVCARLHIPQPLPRHVLLEGRVSASERWNFSFARPFFDRYLDG